MKKVVSIVIALAFSIAASAQLKARWGSIDIRYPLDCKTEVGDYRVNTVAAWRGERVNLQLVVTNEYSEKDCSVEYRFSDLKQGRDVIPASNVVGGFVQPVITDKFTGCGKHAVDAHGEELVADRITDTNPTILNEGSRRGLWLTVQVPQDAGVGTYEGYVELTCNGKKKRYEYKLNVFAYVLPAPKEWSFHDRISTYEPDAEDGL